MEQFNTPIVGEYEDFTDYDHWEETHDENGDYSATMNIYPDVAFFQYGLYAHLVACGPFLFYLAFYRMISGVPTNSTTETTNLMRIFNDKESLLVGYEKPTWAGWGGQYTTTGPTMYGISFGAWSAFALWWPTCLTWTLSWVWQSPVTMTLARMFMRLTPLAAFGTNILTFGYHLLEVYRYKDLREDESEFFYIIWSTYTVLVIAMVFELYPGAQMYTQDYFTNLQLLWDEIEEQYDDPTIPVHKDEDWEAPTHQTKEEIDEWDEVHFGEESNND